MRFLMKTRSLLTALFFTAVLLTGFLAGRAHAAQPHMTAAVRHLRAAHQELQAAVADKGGHREKALRLVHDAIQETEAGIEYARH